MEPDRTVRAARVRWRKERRRALLAGCLGLAIAIVMIISGGRRMASAALIAGLGAAIVMVVLVWWAGRSSRKRRESLLADADEEVIFASTAMIHLDDALRLADFDPPVSPVRHRRIRGEWMTGDLWLDPEGLRWRARGRYDGEVRLDVSAIQGAAVGLDQDGPLRSTAVDLHLVDGTSVSVITQGGGGFAEALRSAASPSRDDRHPRRSS